MIDLHCHIIPWVDDGAQNAKTACVMAQHALHSGVDTIVATPHCNLFGMRGLNCANYRSRRYDEMLGLFRALLRQHGLPLRVLPGAEVFVHPANLSALLEERRLVTLNHSRYLLTEFPFQADGMDISLLLARVAQSGLTPVVAHPERYAAVQDDLSLAAQWVEKGYVIQLNKGSLLGRLGDGAQYASRALLRRGLVHVVATDAHDPRYRPTGFVSLLPVLRELCSPEAVALLLDGNPYRIIHDRPVTPLRAVQHKGF